MVESNYNFKEYHFNYMLFIFLVHCRYQTESLVYIQNRCLVLYINIIIPYLLMVSSVFFLPVFKVALKEAEFQRKEHIRKQGTDPENKHRGSLFVCLFVCNDATGKHTRRTFLVRSRHFCVFLCIFKKVKMNML